MRSKDFPTAPLERIAKKSSKKRIAKEAMNIMREYVLDDATDRAKEIAELTKHSGRKTVLKEDVQFITKRNLPI